MRKITLLFAVLLSLVGVTQMRAQKSVLSEGFESNSLNGWTTQSAASSTGTSNSDKNSGSYCFRFYYNSNPPQYLISPELSIPSNASNIKLSLYYKNHSSTYPETFQIGYSTSTNDVNKFTWDTEIEASNTTWTEYTNTSLTSEIKYIAIRYNSNNKYYLFIDDINLTCDITGPALSVADGTTSIASGYNYNFGLATAGTTKTFTLSNPGTEAAPISVAHTGSFSAELSASSIPAGGEVTLTVTMPATSGNDEITISSTSDAIADFKINVSGTVKDPNKLWCNFSDGIPTTWTNGGVTVSKTGASSYAGSSEGGYVYDSGNGYTLTTPLLEFDGSEKMHFLALRTQFSASYCELKAEYSANGTSGWNTLTVSKAVSEIPYYYSATSWASVEVSGIPAGSYYIRFTPKYVRITDIYGGKESTAPVLALSQPSYDFGLISTSTTTPTPITITNSGKSALTGLNITSNNPNFTVAVTENATTIAANGGTATFTVTMVPNATGAQNATITIKSDNADDLTFNVTGAVAKPGTTTIDFNDNALPTGWSKAGNTSFTDGAAYFYYSTNTLTSPKVTFVAGDFLVVKAKMASGYGYVTVKGSADGTTFTEIKKLDSSVLNQTDYTTCVISDIATTVKYIQLDGYYCYVDEIAGLTYAPVLTVKKGDDVQTTPAAYAFGEVGANQTVTYNFNNKGAGTINITNVTSNNAVFTTNWTESVAASNYDLVITANYDATKAGEQNGAITVTTTEGEFVINLTSTFLAANAPKFALLIGETEQATGADLGFGVITASATKEFIIKNDGTGALNVTSIVLPDADYSTDLETAPTTESPLVIAAGTTKTIKVTLAANSKTIKTGNIVISAQSFEDFTFAANATILIGTETVDFATAIPSTWENENNSWSIQDGAAKCTGKKNLTTSKLQFGENDFFVFKVKALDSGSGDYVTVEGSADNGSTWTAFDKKTYSYSGDFGANTGDYSTIVVSVPSTVNKLRFNGYYVLIDEIAGLVYDANDPKLGIYTDPECTVAATTSVTKDFDFVTADATATYYIKNDGTGTMTLSKGDDPAGFTATLDKTSLGAGEKATLTITMAAAGNAGYHAGNVVVTATDLGTFTVAATGVVREASKFYADFSADGAKFPAGWSTGSWSVSGNTAKASGDLQTTTLVAAAGEQMLIEAISTGSYYSTAALSYSYSIDNGTSWTEATSIVGSLNTSSYTIIPLAVVDADNEKEVLVKLTGSNVSIRRIYGFTAKTEPIMTTTAADIAFGMQTAESAEQTFTISNEGSAKLEDLSVTLGKTGDAAEYSIALYDGENTFSGTDLEAGKSITIKVKQLFDINKLGAKSDVLTIAATGQTPVAINLTGATRDGSKMYVDFEDGNIPEGWTKNTWSVKTTSGNKVAYAGFTASALITAPLTVAENEVLTFKAARQYGSSAPTIQVRYTTNGGITWTEYTDYASQVTSADFVTLELTGVPAGTAVVEFYGRYFYLDEVSGFSATNAPLFDLATSETADSEGKYDFGQSLQAAPADKVFTLTNKGNGNLVSTLAATGDVTFALATENGELSNENKTVTLEPGETATVTVSLIFNATEAGAKSGTVTITSNAPVAAKTLDFTAKVIDPTALNEDFASNAKPEYWYNNGWSFTSGYAYNFSSTNAEFITPKLTVSGTTDAMTYQVAQYSSYSTSAALTVEYSKDRKNWTAATVQPSELTTDFKPFTLSGLEAGNYYVKFTGAQVKLDNIIGWHYATPAAEHDLYLAGSTLPTETVVPGAEYTATVKVASLAAAETVKAELYFGETRVAELTEDASIAKDETKAIELTGNVPTTEGTYEVYAKVYNANATVETEKVNVELAHTRTLAIQSFAREGEGTMEANSSNQISPVFKVTVKNTGTTTLTPTIKVKQGETVVGTATGTALAADATSDEITVNATNMSAGEGGDLNFTAEAYWSTEDGATAFPYATPVTINVTAAAPKFDLAIKGGAAVADGDAVAFGLVKAADKKTYTITNSGTGNLELISIVAPEGFEATTLTDANKTIAANGTLDIDVTLKAEQGKKSGALVFTYKVDATTNKTFTLNLSGRSVAADTWTVDFEDGAIPSNWDNSNGWTVYESDGNKIIRLSGWDAKSIMTPRLSAADGEILTFDVLSLGNEISYAYSTDKTTWSSEVTITTVGEQTFTAPAAGNYYLRFTGRNAYLDNFVGFKLNIPEHDTELAASSVPATGKQYNTYTATVTLKENAGKAEEVTAKLYVGGEEKATKNETITANGTTVVTLTWEPEAVIETAVKAYVKVTGTDIDLTTAEADLTVAEVYTLDETVDYSTGVETISTAETILLKRTFVQGWNTVCLPFAISDIEGFFGAGAKAYEYTNNSEGSLTFKKATSLSASLPYIVYVETAITEPMKVNNVTISSTDNTAFYETHGDVKFQGTYAPIAAGGLTGKHIVANKEGKGKIFTATDKASLKGFRAYFDAPATARLSIVIEGETTGINVINGEGFANGSDDVYNLNGQKVQNVKKGSLYIVNGKKQVVK